MTSSRPYRFLPFRFERRNENVLLINDVGEYVELSKDTFEVFINKTLPSSLGVYKDLKSKGFLFDGNLKNVIELQAIKYRTKKRFLEDFTVLHMLVLTRRCNQDCKYCHATSIDVEDSSIFDMDIYTAKKCIDMAFNSPASAIKIEFQGGEPTLNFAALKAAVLHAKELNLEHDKTLEFVVCTNLLTITDEMLQFFKTHEVYISTSLDGPKSLHDSCRVARDGAGSFDRFIENLDWVKNEYGPQYVSALLTISKNNIHKIKEVVDEYLRLNLDAIYLRKLNPFGQAEKNKEDLGYSTQDYVTCFRDALEYLIKINLQGKFFPEAFTTILLTRILTPYSTGFVDLQSPAGVGICGVIYDTSGDVFVSDEARMLHTSSGDKTFILGNVKENSWQEIFNGSKLREIIGESCVEALPGCHWCVYQPYCGSDPVGNYKNTKSFVSFKPSDDFCETYKGIFGVIFDYLLEENSDVMDVFWSWINNEDLGTVRGLPLTLGEQ